MSAPTEAELAALREQVTTHSQVQDHMEERVRSVEDRLAAVEPVISRVPAVEARVQRMERLFMDVQGDIRRIERTALDYQRRVEEKLDAIVDLLVGSTKLTKTPP